MELFKLFGTIAISNAGANEAIDETTDKAESFGTKLKSGISTVAEWGTAIVGGATVAGAAMIKFAESSAATADHIDKMSQKIGISREAYQELDFICSQSGTSVDNLQMGIKTLTAAMDGARDGTASSVAQFEKLGVAVTNTDGTFRAQEDVFFDTVAALQEIDDQTEKARLATELFGRSGTELMPLLNGASGSIEEMRNQAHELGLVLDDELIDNGVFLTDTIDQLKRSFGSIITQLGAALMPIVEKVAKYVIDKMPKIQTLFQKLEPIITGLLDSLLPPLMDLVEKLLPVIFDLIEQLVPPITKIIDGVLPILVDLLMSIVPVLADVISTILPPIIQLIETLIPYIVQFVEMLLPTLAQLIQELLPIIAQILENVLPVIIQLINQLLPIIIKIIEAVLPVVISLLNSLTPILKALMPILQPILNLLLAVLEPLFQLLNVILPGLTLLLQGVATVIDMVVKPIITWLADYLSVTLTATFDAIIVLIESVCGAFKSAWEGIKEAWQGVSGFFEDIWEGIKSVFGNVAEWFEEIFTKAWEGVKNVFSKGGKIFDGIKEGIAETFTTIVNKLIEGINTVVAVPFNAINDTLNSIRNVGIGSVHPFKGLWGKNPISVPEIPQLYEGTVLEKGQVGLLEGKGAEAVIPLHNNRKWIAKVAEDMTEAFGGLGSAEAAESILRKLDMLISLVQKLLSMNIMLDTGVLVGELAPAMDTELGILSEYKGRGN